MTDNSVETARRMARELNSVVDTYDHLTERFENDDNVTFGVFQMFGTSRAVHARVKLRTGDDFKAVHWLMDRGFDNPRFAPEGVGCTVTLTWYPNQN